MTVVIDRRAAPPCHVDGESISCRYVDAWVRI